MKTHLCLLLLLLAATRLPAQFTLSGRILQYSGKAPLSLNIPAVYGFHRENTTVVPVAANGTFSITLPVSSEQFATLIIQRRFYTLLLTSGKNLVVEADEVNRTLRFVSGSALAENRLLQEVKVDSPPFFWNVSTFNTAPLETLQHQVLLPYARMQNDRIQTVYAANISTAHKKLLAAELKYLGYNYLSDFARTQVSNRGTVDSLVLAVFDSCSIEPEYVPAGPQYYAFADNYLRYLETKAFIKVKKEKIPPNEPIPYFGISLDSATSLVNTYGKPYWRWIASLQHFPAGVAEAYNWQQIQNLYYDRDLSQTRGLAEAFKKQFPASRYTTDIDRMFNELQNMLAAHRNNTRIVIASGHQEGQSIYDVINTFRGKVVYLDIWGTWCGPCKEEIKHLPGLRAAFAGKDVAFLFLDVDDDSRDAIWKEYIRLNGMEGTHLRKTRQTVAPVWKELLAGQADKAEYYPQYFLFDKNGKLVVSKAKRPSEGAALYRQIDAVLAGVE